MNFWEFLSVTLWNPFAWIGIVLIVGGVCEIIKALKG